MTRTLGVAATSSIHTDAHCSISVIVADFAEEVVWHAGNPEAEGAFSRDDGLNRALELTMLAVPLASR